MAQRLQGWRTYPYHRAGSPEPVAVTLWMAFDMASEVSSLACVSRRMCPPRASCHGHGQLTFGSLLMYVWLSGCRAGVHTHTTQLEALSQSWSPYGWRLVSPRRCFLLPVSHVARVHLEQAAMATDNLRLGHYSCTCGSAVAGLAYIPVPPSWKP